MSPEKGHPEKMQPEEVTIRSALRSKRNYREETAVREIVHIPVSQIRPGSFATLPEIVFPHRTASFLDELPEVVV